MQLKATVCRGTAAEIVAEHQRFRKSLFVDRCGWTLDVHGGREIDQFDTPETVHAGLWSGGSLCGSFRAIRSDQPYLAADVFPQLAVLKPYPRRPDVWEISRFGVLAAARIETAGLAYALMFVFAQRMGASALVAIADLAHERVLRSYGIRTQRYGPPASVGVDAAGRTLRAVAGEIPVMAQDPDTLAKLTSPLLRMEIADVSAVFGPSRISA